MRYLHAVIMETLRFFPLVIGSIRKLEKGLVMSGYEVPAGELQFSSVFKPVLFFRS